MVGETPGRYPFSLRPPVGTEAERAEFQRRIALTSLMVFVLALGFWCVNLVTVATLAPPHLQHMWTLRSSQVQLATTWLAGLVWLALRRGAPGVTVLGIVDAASTVALCAGWALMTAARSEPSRADLVGVLACTYTLVMRAALVPSGPARTTAVGLVALAPVVALEVGGAPIDERFTGAFAPAVYLAIWALLGVAATTTISWVIFGLRAQVRKARELGQYLLEEKIGEGGMGAVYRASHALLRRPTAIKLIAHATPETLERFEREVQITAGLTHPNTIAIFDYGRTPDGVFYYAMEYLDGISLEDLVAAAGPQSPARVVNVLLQACGALQEAHDKGFVHRDVKPANLMLTTRGGVPDVIKVLDFGLVSEGPKGAAPSVTGETAILGTPHYMAPECILEPRSVDARADVYALGATAFFLLTGARLFEGKTAVEVCGKHLHETPRAPSSLRADVPPALDRIVAACLEKDRDARPRDAAALAELLLHSGIAPWSRADARAWWGDAPAPKRPERRPAVGESVVIALEDRI